MASRVRLGVSTLNVTRGVGWRARDVNEDIVMARGMPSCVDVQTTTELVSSRMAERICSEREDAESGSVVGGEDEKAWEKNGEA